MGGDWKELLYACESGDIELVQYHIRMGIDPNYQHPEFLTAPLLEAIRFGHLEIAKFLIENGANPAIQEAFGKETPMSIAVEKKNEAAIQLLQEFGIKAEKITNNNKKVSWWRKWLPQ